MPHWPMPFHSPSKQRFLPARHDIYIRSCLFVLICGTIKQHILGSLSRHVGWWAPCDRIHPWHQRPLASEVTAEQVTMAAAACWWPGRGSSAAPRTASCSEISLIRIHFPAPITPHKPAARLTLSLLCSAVQLLINLVG